MPNLFPLSTQAAPAHQPVAARRIVALGALASLALGASAWRSGPDAALWTGLAVAGAALPLLLAWTAWRGQQRAQDTAQRLQELARRDQQLRRAELVAQLGSFDWHLADGRLHWSDGHFRLWGLAPAAQAPDYAAFCRTVHPDDQAVRESQLQQALQGAPYDCHYRMTRADGALRHIHARGEVMFDAAGAAQRMIGTVQDITDRRLADVRLHTHEFVVNTIADPISVIDEQRVFHLVNDAWCRITGLARAQVVGQPPGGPQQWVDSPQREAALQRCLDQGSQQVTLLDKVMPGLGLRSWEVTVYPYSEPQSRRRGAVMVTRDVTARQAAQAAGVENLRLTLNATGDAIFAADAAAPEQPVLFINDRMLQMWAIPPQLAASLTPAALISWSRPYFVDPEREIARLNGVIDDGVPQGDRLVLNDGRVLLWRCVPARQGGRRLRVWGFRDITGQARAEQGLLAAKTEAERANRAKSVFLSGMSHELRTPMNAMLGFAQLLESDAEPALSPRQRGQVQEIVNGGRHLLALINDVLDLARIEADSLPVQRQPVPLHPLLADCVALLAPLAGRRAIRITLPAADDGQAVLADPTRLRQVLLNLLGNAIKYNIDGGWVRIDCQRQAQHVQVAVTDSGPGIAADQQPRLFQRFERLDAAGGPVEGTGIGLALSQRLMQLMQGEIGLHSAPGQGSRFWIRIDCADAGAAPGLADPAGPARPDPAVHMALQPDRGTGGAAPPVPRSVLYIEDNPVNTVLMEAMLARMPGLAVACAASAEAGLALAIAEPPALILADIQMPGMDGFALLRCLREHPATRHVPVIAVSANAMPQDLERGIAAGFADYLTKPLDLAQLLAAVTRALPLSPPPPRP